MDKGPEELWGNIVEIRHRLEDLELAALRGVGIVERLEKLERGVTSLDQDVFNLHDRVFPIKQPYPKPQKEPDLLPCPFCGGDNPRLTSKTVGHGMTDAIYRCRTCYAQASPEAWNQRAEKP